MIKEGEGFVGDLRVESLRERNTIPIRLYLID